MDLKLFIIGSSCLTLSIWAVISNLRIIMDGLFKEGRNSMNVILIIFALLLSFFIGAVGFMAIKFSGTYTSSEITHTQGDSPLLYNCVGFTVALITYAICTYLEKKILKLGRKETCEEKYSVSHISSLIAKLDIYKNASRRMTWVTRASLDEDLKENQETAAALLCSFPITTLATLHNFTLTNPTINRAENTVKINLVADDHTYPPIALVIDVYDVGAFIDACNARSIANNDDLNWLLECATKK